MNLTDGLGKAVFRLGRLCWFIQKPPKVNTARKYGLTRDKY